jgi:predicted short-subunit dehydrogenase-like oxidoreductase (DUF2520 family)
VTRRAQAGAGTPALSTAFVVGAGRVGTGLAVALPLLGVRVLGTWSRTPAAARRARRRTGAPAAAARFPRTIASADVVFLTVPDDAVAELCDRLAGEGRFAPGQVVAHCSGSLDLSPLSPAARAGARPGSLHPLQAFSDPREAAGAFPGSLAVVDGDPGVRAALTRIARGLKMRPVVLPEGPLVRARYHAAAVTAAGHLVALMDLSLELAAAAGLDPADALGGLSALAQGSLANLERSGDPAAALTGPVARGDAKVIEKHLAALEGLPEASRALYRMLVERSADLVDRRGGDTRAVRRALKRRR